MRVVPERDKEIAPPILGHADLERGIQHPLEVLRRPTGFDFLGQLIIGPDFGREGTREARLDGFEIGLLLADPDPRSLPDGLLPVDFDPMDYGFNGLPEQREHFFIDGYRDGVQESGQVYTNAI
jgi:hypothetical protein